MQYRQLSKMMVELEKDEWQSVKKPITIRLNQADIIAAKKQAVEAGMPYQTLLASLIHRYLKGDIIIKKPI